MKKVVLILLMIWNLSIFSQETINKYEMSFFKDLPIEFAIKAGSYKNEKTFKFYIEAISQDSYTNDVELIIKSKSLDKFKSNLLLSRKKFKEWKEVSEKNNVKKALKNIKVKRMNINARFKKYGEWHYDHMVEPIFKFTILKGKPVLIIMNKFKLKSNKNQFITSDGFYIIFTNVDEINDFISKLDKYKAIKVLSKMKSENTLFKD